MIADARLCQICADTYTQPLTYDDGEGVHFLILKEAGATVIAFRDSVVAFDWAN